jgi:hypothetical protein
VPGCFKSLLSNFGEFFIFRELINQRNGLSGEEVMKPTRDEDENLAKQLLAKRVRPTIALAALIFGIAGVSALWLLVIAGLAARCSLLTAFVGRVWVSKPSHSLSYNQEGRRGI